MWHFAMDCDFPETQRIHRVSASILCAIVPALGLNLLRRLVDQEGLEKAERKEAGVMPVILRKARVKWL